jgi:hypothetical protein
MAASILDRSDFERLSFVRPSDATGGFSAWDPKLKVRDIDSKDIEAQYKSPDTLQYVLGCNVGRRAAIEFENFLAKSAEADDENLAGIIIAMVGILPNERVKGEIIGFLSQLESTLMVQLRRTVGIRKRPVARRKRA